MMTLISRIIAARPEVQGAVIALFNLLAIFGVANLTEEQVGAVNLALIAWMGLAQKVLFERDLDSLA